MLQLLFCLSSWAGLSVLCVHTPWAVSGSTASPSRAGSQLISRPGGVGISACWLVATPGMSLRSTGNRELESCKIKKKRLQSIKPRNKNEAWIYSIVQWGKVWFRVSRSRFELLLPFHHSSSPKASRAFPLRCLLQLLLLFAYWLLSTRI